MDTNKMASLMLIAILLLAPQASLALNCGQVVNWLLPCLQYLKTGAGPSSVCCNGVKTLYNTADTIPEKQTACACIKQAAKGYSINYDFANSLPPKCTVKVDYKLSPDIDCSKIH